MTTKKITVNKAQCAVCQDTIESRYRQDMVWCKCGAIAVDGGKDYIRRGGELELIIELTTYDT